MVKLPFYFAAMGRHFGQLTRVRNIITYSLSPFEQRAFAGAVSKGIPNLFRRFAGQVFRVVPREYSFFWSFHSCVKLANFFWEAAHIHCGSDSTYSYWLL